MIYLFTFLGYNTNPDKFVKACDLYVCSSLSEGFSTSVTESLIVGTPVVTTLCSGIDDEESLSTAKKAGLVNLLNNDVVIDGKLFACARAIEKTVSSLTGFIQSNRDDLLLPEIIDLEQHSYE